LKGAKSREECEAFRSHLASKHYLHCTTPAHDVFARGKHVMTKRDIEILLIVTVLLQTTICRVRSRRQ